MFILSYRDLSSLILSYPLSCLTASLNKWIFTQMTPQLHLEFGTLRSLSVPFFVGRNKNKTPATSHRRHNETYQVCRGLPRVKTQRNILHQDHIAPVGVCRTPDGIPWKNRVKTQVLWNREAAKHVPGVYLQLISIGWMRWQGFCMVFGPVRLKKLKILKMNKMKSSMLRKDMTQ